MPAVVIPKSTRAEEKDLAAVTRVNTRKNKANAVPPKVVLARQAEDPGWRMRERKGVFDARDKGAREGGGDEDDEGEDARRGPFPSSEERAAAADSTCRKNGRKTRRAKGVRWAEELVRYQGDGHEGGGEVQAAAAPAKPLKPASSSRLVLPELATYSDPWFEPLEGPKGGESLETAEPTAQSNGSGGSGSSSSSSSAVVTTASPREDVQEPPPAAETQQPQTMAKTSAAAPVAAPRRTRTSRLQMPTPIRNKVGLPAPSTVTTAPSSAAAKDDQKAVGAGSSSSSRQTAAKKAAPPSLRVLG
ncbi:hypothetical protein VTK73DRAFT_6413 [Phialemonium thermophilum]|uniref:Uncharacterized protein n=1 Tax=Phialemonium thermophilum TaxID=223376 RepID=A0ABR3UZU0_9PEZI